jgi:hypothetical protein
MDDTERQNDMAEAGRKSKADVLSDIQRWGKTAKLAGKVKSTKLEKRRWRKTMIK